MTNHPTSEELFAYRDGELALEKRALVEAHVLSCNACQRWLDEMSDTEGMLRQEHEEPGERYFEALTQSVMARVAPGAHGKAPARADAAGAAGTRQAETVRERPGRRRSLEDEPRGRAPRLPWPAIVSAVSAAAAVVVVAVMLFQHPSLLRQTPEPSVLGRAKDAAGETKEAAPPAHPAEETPATGGAVAETGSVAKMESSLKGAAEPAPLAAANGAPAGANQPAPEVRTQSAAEAGPEAALQKSAAAPAAPQAAERARADDEAQASGGLPDAAQASAFPALAARYGLPLLYDPSSVSSDALLRAEPDLRALYMMGRAGDDSARVRLYLAEAARARAGDSPDTETFDSIVHHYQRAVRLARDPATGRMAMKRLQDFVSNHAPPR